MDAKDVLIDGFGRVPHVVHAVLGGCDEDALTVRLDPEANTIAWLVWHLARVQDAQVAEVAGHEQVWTADGWARRFDLPFGDDEIGYGFDAGQVGQVRAGAELLRGYLDAVHERTVRHLGALTGDALDRVVDDSYDPPVTLGVRLISVLDDDLQHAGQAALLAGLVRRRG